MSNPCVSSPTEPHPPDYGSNNPTVSLQSDDLKNLLTASPSDGRINIPTVSPPSDDDDEVTETKIVGVTESGVIRKRSFKRKLTKEEKSKRKFGNDKAEYDKIMTKVMADRYISSALEGLQERWKMLSLMHSDCLEMLAQWESRRQERMRANRCKRSNDAVKVLVVISVVVFMIGWFIKCCVW